MGGLTLKFCGLRVRGGKKKGRTGERKSLWSFLKVEY